MSGTAPYEVNVTGSDDETFVFSIPFEKADGTAFPFSDYTIEYSLTRAGCSTLSLTLGNGITVAAPVVTFRKTDGGSLQQGQYEHGCRVRNNISGDYTQVFDGAVTIGEGNF